MTPLQRFLISEKYIDMGHIAITSSSLWICDLKYIR